MNASLIAGSSVEGPLPRPGLDVHGGRGGAVRTQLQAAGGWSAGTFMWPGPARWGAWASVQPSACASTAASPWPLAARGLERVARDVGAAGRPEVAAGSLPLVAGACALAAVGATDLAAIAWALARVPSGTLGALCVEVPRAYCVPGAPALFHLAPRGNESSERK